jgi:hypothetical protein
VKSLFSAAAFSFSLASQAFKFNDYSSSECPAGWVRKGFRHFGDTDIDLTP